MHDPWIERLSEYLDEGLSRSDREALEQHLLRCRECTSTVEELTAAPEPARNLPASNATTPGAMAPEAVSARRTEATPHEEAIAELRKALAKERDRLDPATVRTLESNLAIIDLAIDQAKRALAADPANTYVTEHLAETMRRKIELLQRATMLASTNGAEGTR